MIRIIIASFTLFCFSFSPVLADLANGQYILELKSGDKSKSIEGSLLVGKTKALFSYIKDGEPHYLEGSIHENGRLVLWNNQRYELATDSLNAIQLIGDPDGNGISGKAVEVSAVKAVNLIWTLRPVK